jgi:hypothetical protein
MAKSFGAVIASHRLPISTIILQRDSAFKIVARGVEQGRQGRNVGERGWQREFDDPIPLPDGRVLVTSRDAATFITALPKKEAALPEWQAAIEALMLVVEHGGPTMFARIGVMRALNRGACPGVQSRSRVDKAQ